MGSFANSFSDSFKTGAAIGSNAALETMKEKIKQDTLKAEKQNTLLNIKAIGTQQADKVAKMNLDPETKKYIEDSLVVLDTLNDPEVAQKHLSSITGLVESNIKSRVSNEQDMSKERFKSGMLGVTEVIKAMAERGGTFSDGTPITAESLQDFGQQASDRLLQNIGSMPSSTKETVPSTPIKDSIMGAEVAKTTSPSLLNTPIRSKASFKAEEKAASDTATAEKTSKGTYRFMQQFDRSISELRKFDPEFDKVGASGWLSRKQAMLAEKLDELPETKALGIQVQPMANGMAREIEGGRVTDQDRKIYADSFANGILNPGPTNMRLLSQSIIGLLDKGGNENGKITNQLQMLAKSDTNLFKGVIAQVLMEYPELAKQIYGEDYEVVE